MSRVWMVQISCIAVSILSMIVMGTHLFVGDGISNPSPVVEITGVLALVGLTGNSICSFVRYAQEKKEKERRNDQ